MRVEAVTAALLGVCEWAAVAAAQPADTYGTAPPAPEGPSTLNDGLLVILIILGIVLLVGLCAVLLYVVCLKKRIDAENLEEKKKDEKVQRLLSERDTAEQQLMETLAAKMQKVGENFVHANTVHAKFIKDHNPEKFDELRRGGEIHVEGDSEDESFFDDSEDDMDAYIERQGYDPDQLNENQRALFTMQWDCHRRERELDREIRRMEKGREQRQKEMELEEVRLGLEQRLVDLEAQEKSDELKRLERKQREQEVLDNVRATNLLKFGPGGEVVRGRSLGVHEQVEPYESDEDLSEDAPEAPDHLDDLSARGRLLKRRLREIRAVLAAEKDGNKQRQNELERDMALMRLRLQQEQRKQQRQQQKRRRVEAEQADADPNPLAFQVDRAARSRRNNKHTLQQPAGRGDYRAPQSARVRDEGAKDEVDVGSAGTHRFEVPSHQHRTVPHFVTAPWAVEGVTTASTRSRRVKSSDGVKDAPAGRSEPGRRRGSASKHMLRYVAEAMRDESLQREALDRGEYAEGPAAADAESPLRHGLPTEAVPLEAIPAHIRDKRLML